MKKKISFVTDKEIPRKLNKKGGIKWNNRF